MSGLRLINSLRVLLNKRRAEEQLQKELQFHLEQLTEENRAAGMSEDEARYAALSAIGNLGNWQEQCRDEWRTRWLESIAQDIRYGFRQIRKNPMFAFIAILTLAVGIGATTVIFTQLNAVFLRSLPLEKPEQLRFLSWTSRKRSFAGPAFATKVWEQRIARGETIEFFSYAAFDAVRRKTTTLDSVGCSWAGSATALVESGKFDIELVSGDYFRTLALTPILGRTITQDEDRPNANTRVAVISHGFWQRAFGGHPDVLGQTLRIRGTPFEVIGVMPAGFAGLDPASTHDVFLPYSVPKNLVSRGAFPPNSWFACRVLARVKKDVSDEQAQAETEILLREAIVDQPGPQDYELPHLRLTNAGRGADSLRKATALSFQLLTVTAVIILLITCANIAGLLVSRGRARQKEIATRLAIGAGRSRITRQLFIESLLIAAAGGAAGIMFAYALNPLLPSLLRDLGQVPASNAIPAGLGRVNLLIAPDRRVLIAAVAVTVLTSFLFGLVPAIRTTRINLVAAMKQMASSGDALGLRTASSKALIAIQVALSMLLLIGAGFLIRTFINLRAVHIGYKPEKLLFVSVDSDVRRPTQPEEMLARFASIPGVTSVSLSHWPLFTNAEKTTGVCAPKFPQPDRTQQFIDSDRIAPRFFETWGIDFRHGADFTAADQPAVIVNETLARQFWGRTDVIGETLGVGPCPGVPKTIVGVVGDHTDRQRVSVTPIAYFPYHSPGMSPLDFMTYAVRTANDSRSAAPVMRRVIAEWGGNAPTDVTTGIEYRDRLLVREPLLAKLVSFFGLFALVISCLGLYGLLASVVSGRTTEVGIRMALGAQRRSVVWLVVRESLIPVSAGTIIGILAAIPLTRAIESILFGVPKYDPVSILASVFIFLLVAGVAAFIPARRAARLDPMRALRYE